MQKRKMKNKIPPSDMSVQIQTTWTWGGGGGGGGGGVGWGVGGGLLLEGSSYQFLLENKLQLVIFQGGGVPPVSAHIKVSTLVRHIRDWISQEIYHTDFLTAKNKKQCWVHMLVFALSCSWS